MLAPSSLDPTYTERMRVGALEVPLGLVQLIQAKRWPQSDDEERRQHLVPIVPTDRVHRFAPEEDELYLYAPPFRTVQQCCESGETFWEESIAAPAELDFARAVPIADFGLGTDAPVVLDYAAGAAPPRVRHLAWSRTGNDNHWVLSAETFDEFARLLGLHPA